jgi:hypothetical protein
MCRQNPNVIKNPLVPSKELSPLVVATGVQGIKWAIDVSYSMPESGLSLLQKNSILDCMVLLM